MIDEVGVFCIYIHLQQHNEVVWNFIKYNKNQVLISHTTTQFWLYFIDINMWLHINIY